MKLNGVYDILLNIDITYTDFEDDIMLDTNNITYVRLNECTNTQLH